MVNPVIPKKQFISAQVYTYGKSCPLVAHIIAAASEDERQKKKEKPP